MLLVFIIVVILITGIYQTFSLYTASNGFSVLDGLKTYKFILGDDNTENSVVIAAGASKNIAITVSNKDKIKLKYGVYYSSLSDLDNVDLGYDRNTEYLPNGMIEPNCDYIVTVKIDNHSSSNITISFGIIYGFENGGELELETNQHFLEQKWNFPLSEVEAGSYVRYIGNNGCPSGHCDGTNANYVSDEDMGYCSNSSYKFSVNGWRVAYIRNNSAHLISAGSPECLCTNSDGTISSNSCSSAEDTSLTNPNHFTNLNNASQKYCNSAYINNEFCGGNMSIWNIGSEDFKTITDSSISFCNNNPESLSCGYQNSLIDNGSFYWLRNTVYNTAYGYLIARWFPYWKSVGYSFIGSTFTSETSGIRPVIKLDSSVVVTSGAGTYQDPYIIDNLSTIKDLSGNMNNGVNRDGDWNQADGSITTDGVSSYVECGLAGYDFKNSVSLVARIKFNSLDSSKLEQAIIGNWESAGFGMLVLREQQRFGVSMFIDGGWKVFFTTLTPVIDTWYTIVMTYDGNNVNIYINGQKSTLDTTLGLASEMSGNITVSSMPMVLGANPEISGTNLYHSAVTLSDALIFTRALTESEIATNYSDIPNLINKEGLLLYYDFKR